MNQESFLKRHKPGAAFYFLLIVLGILGVFVIPYVRMGYFGDDFSDAYRSLTISIHDYWAYFFASKTLNESLVLPQFATYLSRDFLAVYYRPLWVVLGHLQALFGMVGPYSTLYVSGFLHICIVGLLYAVLLPYAGAGLGALLAGLYSFHPTLGMWFGRLSSLQYLYSTLFVMMTMMCLYQFMTHHNRRWMVGAVIAFSAALLTRESTVLLPVWLTMAAWWYADVLHVPRPWRLSNSFGVMLPLYITAVVYGEIRFRLFPLKIEMLEFMSPWSIISMLYDHVVFRSHHIITYIADVLGIGAFPIQDAYLKIGLIAIILSVIAMLFIVSEHKKAVMLWLTGFILMSWPVFFFDTANTYLYESYPFLLIALAYLIVPRVEAQSSAWVRHAVFIMLALVGLVGIVRGRLLMTDREQVTSIARSAIAELSHDRQIRLRTICLVGVPARYFSAAGLYHAFILNGTKYVPREVYSDDILTYEDESSESQWGLVKPGTSPHLNRRGNTLMVEYPNLEQSWMRLLQIDGKDFNFAFGRIELMRHYRERAEAFRITFDRHFMSRDPVFVSWDDQKQLLYVL